MIYYRKPFPGGENFHMANYQTATYMTKIHHQNDEYTARREYQFIPTAHAQSCLLYRTSSGHMCPTSKYKVTRKRFDSFLMLYVVEGILEFKTEKSSCCVHSGEAVILNCYVPHNYFAITDGEFYWTHFDGNGALRIFSCMAQQDDLCVFSGCSAERIGNFLMSTINHESLIRLETEYSMALYSLLINLFSAEAEHLVTTDPDQTDFVNLIDNFIQNHYSESISLQDIAQFAMVSESQLIKEYKKATGITPYAAFMKYRITVACHLLNTTHLPVTKIAENCGYSSLANFTYGFHKETGMSPTEFRTRKSKL